MPKTEIEADRFGKKGLRSLSALEQEWSKLAGPVKPSISLNWTHPTMDLSKVDSKLLSSSPKDFRDMCCGRRISKC
jgi:hypothetical protein